MNKDVILSISGLHYDATEMGGGEDQPIEVITPAKYFHKNKKHYIKYEELIEGVPGVIHNTVKVHPEKLEIIKTGLSNTSMTFEKDKIHLSDYETPYGKLLVGIHTRVLEVVEEENKIGVKVNYELDVNGSKLADCNIEMGVRSVK